MSPHPAYPPRLAITPLSAPPEARVLVPGSKSITNRALVLGAVTCLNLVDPDGAGVRVVGALRSEDTEVMVDSLRRLGFAVETDWDQPRPVLWVHQPTRQRTFLRKRADLYVANSGTSMRFLTALVCLGEGTYRLDGVPRMRQRPIRDLLDALTALGVDARSENGDGCPPVLVAARGLAGGDVRIRGDVSSQFLSGLLMASPGAAGRIVVAVDGPLVSWPYIGMTVDLMKQCGCRIRVEDGPRFVIDPGQDFGLAHLDVEPDASAASYFWAAAAITGGTVTVEGLTTRSLQGDVRFVDLLEEMGCAVTRADAGITVRGGMLRGIDIDMNDISDTVMTLGVVALFAEGPTVIRNVGHIRHKETDRLAALATELRRVGADVEEREDGLTIRPRPLHGADIATYDDHRMAMSLALVGLRVPGIVVCDPGCVAKTYPRFFDDLEKLR